MKTKFLSLAMIAVFAISTISCSKSDPAPTPAPPVVVVNPPVTTTTDGFSWSINGETTKKTGTFASYQFLSPNTTTVIMTPQNGSAGVVIRLDVFGRTAGTYQLGNVNTLTYIYSATESLAYPTGGSITITSIANNKCSGTFTAAGNGNNVTSISGTFTNIAFF